VEIVFENAVNFAFESILKVYFFIFLVFYCFDVMMLKIKKIKKYIF
jgi:hypothetical protein